MKPDWKAREFHVGNAEFLGQASALAYQTKAVVRRAVKSWNMELVGFFDFKETQAYLAGDNQTYILAFRGTEPNKIRDWLTDLDAIQTNGPVGKVHEGFYCALNYIWLDLWNILDKQRGKRELWVTGHSLGGALATLAVAKIRLDKGHPVSGLYTFGQPRVGDGEFSNRFNQDFEKQTFRFVNYRDVVPRVPVRAMNYRDTGTFQYFNEQGYDPATRWAELLLHRIGDNMREIAKLKDVEDHYMERYLAKLKALANRDVMHHQ